MERVTYLQLFCRHGRIIIANSAELNAHLPDDKDYIIIVPVAFNSDHVQVREADKDELKNLLPNTIITSPFKPYIYNNTPKNLRMNSKIFDEKKLIESAKELAKKLTFQNMFGL